MNAQIFRFKVGNFDCISLFDWHEIYKATDNFKSTPEDELARRCREQGLDPDGYALDYNCLVVNNGQQWILLDAGNGKLFDSREAQLTESLHLAGIHLEDIQTIILSHLNGDHFGGLTDPDGNYVFPNAKIYVWESEWQHWTSDAVLAEREKMFPGATAFYQKHLISLRPHVEFVRQDGEIVPGVGVLHTPGHTVGHMVITVESAGEKLLFLGDAIVVSVSVAYPEMKPVFDWYDPDMAIETRKRLRRLAAEENYLVHGFHFPFPGLGHIRPAGDTFRWEILEA